MENRILGMHRMELRMGSLVSLNQGRECARGVTALGMVDTRHWCMVHTAERLKKQAVVKSKPHPMENVVLPN